MPQQLVWSCVQFAANGDTTPGYLARPAEGGPYPAVVVIQEWWGLEPHIQDVTQRFAREGYVALAPDLYHGRVATEPDDANKMRMELDMPRAVKEILGAASYLKAQSFSRGQKVGVIGFCMGGGLSLLTACQSSAVDACVVFYGRPPDPIDQVQNITCPVLGVFGEADQGIPVAAVENLRAALNRHNKRNDIHIYPQAPHAFFNDTKASYRAEAAKDAWQKTLNFYQQNLRG